jgi:EmrB/QacA subfamily drug resistance transporter
VTDPTPHRWWTLAALAFSLFMIMLDNTIVNVALSAIQEDLGVGLSRLEWTVNAYALSFAVLLLLGGGLADRVGRRRIFLLGLGVFTLASLACGLSTGAGELIGARAVQGIGAAFMLPAALGTIPAVFPARERGAAIGIWAGVSLTALTFGPLIGGLVIEYLSWHWIFFVNVPIGVLGLIAAVALVPESRDRSREQRIDVPGILTSATGLVGLSFALIEGNAHGWASPLILASLAAAGVGFGAFVLVERRRRLPMLDLSLFRDPTFAGANLVALLSVLAMFGVFFFFPIYLQSILGFSAVQAGATFLPMTVVLAGTTPLAGRLTDRHGPRAPMAIGMTLVAFALLLATRLDESAGFWNVAPTLFLAGVGFALTMTPMTAAVLMSAPDDKAAVASAVVNTFRQVGGSLGVAVMGAVVAGELHGATPSDARFAPAFVGGFQIALLIAAAIALAGAAIAAVMVGRGPAAVVPNPAPARA